MSETIGFYLLGFKGYECLKRYLQIYSPSTVEFVAIGRDQGVDNDYYNEITELCKLLTIKVIDRSNIALMSFSKNTTRIAIGWKWIIADTKSLIIFHDSLLPKYRGFAPVVNALIQGEETIGVTALWATDDYDVGDIISQRRIDIVYPVKIREVIRSLVPLYTDILLEISQKIHNKLPIEAKIQCEEDATYSAWRDQKDYEIPWSSDSLYIKRLVDAVGQPYGGATSLLKGKIIKIYDVELVNDISISDRISHVGKVIRFEDNKPVVICGRGLIKITEFIDIETARQPEFTFRTRFGV